MDHPAGFFETMTSYQGVCSYFVRGVVVVHIYYHSLGSNVLTLCSGLMACDFKMVGYITLTKPGNKTGKYLSAGFHCTKGLGNKRPSVSVGRQSLTLPQGLSSNPGPTLSPCPLTLDLALGSPHLGSRPLGQAPQCVCHWVDGNPGPLVILPLCQMTLIPHQLHMEGTTSTADPGSDVAPLWLDV